MHSKISRYIIIWAIFEGYIYISVLFLLKHLIVSNIKNSIVIFKSLYKQTLQNGFLYLINEIVDVINIKISLYFAKEVIFILKNNEM